MLALTPAAALAEYLETHGLSRVAKRLASSGVIDVVATAAPGIDDIVVLGKLKQLERSGNYDLIVVDGPAAGHAITFLMAPANLLTRCAAARSTARRSRSRELLTDPARSQVVLVTLPETTPVNELDRDRDALEDEVVCTSGRWSSTRSTTATICRSTAPSPARRCAPRPSSATPAAACIDDESQRLAEALDLPADPPAADRRSQALDRRRRSTQLASTTGRTAP